MTETISFTPREIVSELDRYIVGQNDAKRAVAIALRMLTRPGDTVAIESPTYYGLLQVLEQNDMAALQQMPLMSWRCHLGLHPSIHQCIKWQSR